MVTENVGTVVQIIGPVIDIRFERGKLPSIYNAIKINSEGIDIVAEVMQYTGNDTVRCVSMNSTDGLKRGMKAVDTGEPIKVPVGSFGKSV